MCLRAPFAENKYVQFSIIYDSIMSRMSRFKPKQMSFVSNGGKFKLYTVLKGLIFPAPTQPRISFERAIVLCAKRFQQNICLIENINFYIFL
jgi:hypothetical protein